MIHKRHLPCCLLFLALLPVNGTHQGDRTVACELYMFTEFTGNHFRQSWCDMHTYMYIYIYIYICVCMCMCECVSVGLFLYLLCSFDVDPVDPER